MMTPSFHSVQALRRYAFALLLAALGANSVLAQTDAGIDPPGRVARFSAIEGNVSFSPPGVEEWNAAVPNRPLASGDRIWTAERSRSELHIGSTAARLGSETSLNMVVVDDDLTQLQLTQGVLSLRVRALFEGQRLQIDTPNLAFVVSQPGEYRIDVHSVRNATRISVPAGSGTVYGEGGVAQNLGSGLQTTFAGTGLAQVAVQDVSRDGFDAWASARDRAEDQSISARYVSRETVGYQQLDQYGDWATDASYGPVWYPRAVAADWAPYRAGHWAQIAPWGWTWVDDAPWGFAPSHYGRWAYVSNRWGWVPGPVAQRPVYAPALVGFVGGGANFSFQSHPGRAGVAWFPLAPGEAWRPHYRASPRYTSRVNQHAGGQHHLNPSGGFRHQRLPQAVTAVGADTFTQGRPVRNDHFRLRQDELNRAQVVAPPQGNPQRYMRPGVPLAGSTAAPPATVSGREALMQRAGNERANDRINDRMNDRSNDRNGWRDGGGGWYDNNRRPRPSDSGVRPAEAAVAPAPAIAVQPQNQIQVQQRPQFRQDTQRNDAPPPQRFSSGRPADSAVEQQQLQQRMQQREAEQRGFLQRAQERAQAQAQAQAQVQAQQRIQQQQAAPLQARPDGNRMERAARPERPQYDNPRRGGGNDDERRGQRSSYGAARIQ